MRYLLIIILMLSLSGCAEQSDLGSADDVEINYEKELSKVMQANEKIKTGKYKYVKEYEKNGLEYSQQWYKTNDGEIGWTFYAKKKIGEDIYLKAESTGVEAKRRSFDWTLQVNDEMMTEDIIINQK